MMRTKPGMLSSATHEAGFSLIEGLMAAALLLVIAVSVLPLFTRALESNISGGRASQLSTFVSADIEAVNQAPVDSAAWQIGAAPAGVLDLGTQLWDIGPLYDTSSPNHLGDERWIDEGDPGNPPAGPVMWSRNTTVRKFSLADLQILIGSDPTGGLVTGGGAGASPFLLDNPLTGDANAHLTEIRVTIKEQRDALPAASGQRITIGHIRAF